MWFASCGGVVDVAGLHPLFRRLRGNSREKEIRALADVGIRWAGLPRHQRPRVIMLENVGIPRLGAA